MLYRVKSQFQFSPLPREKGSTTTSAVSTAMPAPCSMARRSSRCLAQTIPIASSPRKPSISAWGFTRTQSIYRGRAARQLRRMAVNATSASSRQSTLSIWHQAALLRKNAGLKAISAANTAAGRSPSFSRPDTVKQIGRTQVAGHGHQFDDQDGHHVIIRADTQGGKPACKARRGYPVEQIDDSVIQPEHVQVRRRIVAGTGPPHKTQPAPAASWTHPTPGSNSRPPDSR